MAGENAKNEVNIDNPAVGFFKSLTTGRAILLGFGLFLIVLIAIASFALTKNPTKALLYSGLDVNEVPAILEVLEANEVSYDLQGQDTILVAASKLSHMRMELATKGLPRGGAKGYDAMNGKDDVYGKSEMEQHVLFKQVTEQEIVMSIEYLDIVKSARVLLSIPKSTRLIKNKGLVKANAVVQTWGGEKLSKDQVDAIVKIIVGAVPELHRENVSLVDGNGKQLNTFDGNELISTEQLDYINSFENLKQRKIIEMVESFIGVGNVKAVVSADIDFSHREVRTDAFDSENPSIRSRQVAVNNQSLNSTVPGSISNQPPAAGMAPEKITEIQNKNGLVGSSEEITNYEIDKKSLYEVRAKGDVKRLTVSVVVNQKLVDSADGTKIYQNRTKDELDRIMKLVTLAAGLDLERGDDLFISAEEFEELEPNIVISDEAPDFWERHWFGDVINQIVFLVFALIVFFGIIKPLFTATSQTITVNEAKRIKLAQDREDAEKAARERALASSKPKNEEEIYIETRDRVQGVVTSDSKRAEQVLKHWSEK